MQTSIYDQAEKAKQEGIELVFRNANTIWKQKASEQLYRLALSRETFTSDDILIPLEEEGIVTKDNRAIAAILQAAKRLNFIESTGTFVTCKRKSRHNAPIMVWRSLIKAS